MSDVGKVPARWRRRARRRWVFHYAQVICSRTVRDHHLVDPCAGCVADADVIYRYRLTKRFLPDLHKEG